MVLKKSAFTMTHAKPYLKSWSSSMDADLSNITVVQKAPFLKLEGDLEIGEA